MLVYQGVYTEWGYPSKSHLPTKWGSSEVPGQGHQLPRRRADQALQTTGGGGEGTLPIAAAKHVYLGPGIGELSAGGCAKKTWYAHAEPYVYKSIHLKYPFIHLSIYPFIHLSIHPSVCQSVYLCLSLSILSWSWLKSNLISSTVIWFDQT